MKRIISLLLAAVMVCSFASCKKGNKNQQIGTDVEYYANLGKMPECEYELGFDVDKLIDVLEKKATAENAGEEDYYTSFEIDERTAIMTSGFSFYYFTDKKDKGISCIVSNEEAFGFKQGTVSVEVRDALKSYGFESTQRNPIDGELFFIPGAGDNMTCMEYGFKNATVLFVFDTNELCATAIFTKD